MCQHIFYDMLRGGGYQCVGTNGKEPILAMRRERKSGRKAGAKFTHGLGPMTVAVAMLLVSWTGQAVSEEQEQDSAAPSTVLLRMAKTWWSPPPAGGGTIWRYHETWRPDAIRDDNGRLVRVEPYSYFGFRKTQETQEALPSEPAAQDFKNTGTAFPAKGWREPDFDDGAWQRQGGPLVSTYRSLALVCVRGKFEVRDPSRISGLALELTVQGGAVAYLNGLEAGRVGLPAGEITPETLAEDYPPETDDGGKAFVGGKGLINQTYLGNFAIRHVAGLDATDKLLRNAKGTDEEKKALASRYRQRFRKLEVKIPTAFLRKGVNVLAVEVHRAPAHAVMFTAQGAYHPPSICSYSWNRCTIDDLTLSAAGDASAVVSNVERPAGFQVWNATIWKNLKPSHYGDPNEPLRPIRLFGLRNGAYSGQVVVSSPKPIHGLQVALTDLKSADGGAIPATAIEVGYPQWVSGPHANRCLFDRLETRAPDEMTETAATFGSPAYPGAIQPIWITVQAPRDAKPGEYAGAMTISAAGEQPVDVSVALRVLGGWTLPDPKDFTTFVGAIQCPDSVAMQYGVPMWSEAHWKYLEKTFELMGRIGVKDLHIPLLAKTNLGNAQSMVRWIRQPDGTHTHDFSIAEKYLDLARRHLGNLAFVVLWISDKPFTRGDGNTSLAGGEMQTLPVNGDMVIMPCTEFDPASVETREIRAPQWGTPEARTFWKPVIDGMRGMLAKRGLEQAMLFGAGTAGRLGPKCAEDTQALAPDVRWYNREHGGMSNTIGGKDSPRPVAYTSMGHQGNLEVFWDPDEEEHYGWMAESPHVVTSSAWQMYEGAEHATFRLFGESTMLSSQRVGKAGSRVSAPFRGISTQGVDYWPLLDSEQVKGKKVSLLSRYTGQGGVNSGFTQHWLVGPGRDGPVTTCRLHLMREALQEAEIRVFVQNALWDETLRTKLGPELAKRCKDICDERTRIFRYCSYHWVFLKYDNMPGYDRFFDEDAWLRNSETLYRLAGKVAEALGK